ncbi:diaminobutyrate--2-oxoglutarate transaminase [Microbulbifer rhizosphaerae]|uniref:Diaminobutyrate-2-oxoglutarate transaminase n=1 Tax=Microbulbifer rhizosphaerae TaxID=1562603 RepID=A0A7W4W7N9_9GAMM|nr:diaminobutyrate--2-oxoglutarate transaminase [Microbulbifer rhizosphaerae]MBB3059222.1 diaminobutyrate-2-oxoglutarate transaminase [Microbulbifer rhizosphaerae]
MDAIVSGQPAPDSAGLPGFDLASFAGQPLRQLDGNEILERQARRESNARSYPRRLPLALAEGRGIYLRDTAGQLYIDCLAAAGTLALGHHHPATSNAIQKALADGLPLQTLDLATPLKDRFVSTLFDLLPGTIAGRAKIQFCGTSGADAVEAAIKLAKTATGRQTVVAFSGAYHGMTQGTLSLMGNLAPKQPLGSLLPGVQFLPFPQLKRCPLGLGGEAGIDASLQLLDTLLTDPEAGVVKPAAVIVEAVQGEAGALPAPPRWLRGLRELTRRHGIVLILDEVQAGMGRTGRPFAFEHAGIEPDVIVLSKAIGGGLPLSVLVYDEALDTWQPGAHAGTFRGNQLAMAAGTAVMEILRSEQLDAQAESVGNRLHAALANLDSPLIGEVRGLGLMQGVEIVDPEGEPDALGNRPLDGSRARALQRACLQRGLILEVGGRHSATLRFLPPLIIQAEEMDVVVEQFAEAVAEVAGCADFPGAA